MARANLTRKELIVAFNLYCKIPFGKIHNINPDVIELARVLGRTPSSLSWKLANFASLDPLLKKRNISGATHGSGLEREIWEEFNENWDRLASKASTSTRNVWSLSARRRRTAFP
jgi:putative restriction endonuclease